MISHYSRVSPSHPIHSSSYMSSSKYTSSLFNSLSLLCAPSLRPSSFTDALTDHPASTLLDRQFILQNDIFKSFNQIIFFSLLKFLMGFSHCSLRKKKLDCLIKDSIVHHNSLPPNMPTPSSTCLPLICLLYSSFLKPSKSFPIAVMGYAFLWDCNPFPQSFTWTSFCPWRVS